MTNLGSAKEIMGRIGGEQTDGMIPAMGGGVDQGDQAHRQPRHGSVLRMEGERGFFDREVGSSSVVVDSVRNQRSVSVDSGLQQREKGVSYDRHQRPIYEEAEEEEAVPMSEEEAAEGAETGERRGRRVNQQKSGLEGGDEIDRMIAKGKRATTKSGSRLRGRTAIHN